MEKVKVTILVPATLRAKFNKKSKKERKTSAALIRAFMKDYVKG